MGIEEEGCVIEDKRVGGWGGGVREVDKRENDGNKEGNSSK